MRFTVRVLGLTLIDIELHQDETETEAADDTPVCLPTPDQVATELVGFIPPGYLADHD